MTKRERAKKIRIILEKLYPETPIPLEHTDNYTLLIAVLLSAQCTDVRVNKITPALFTKADNPHKMVQLKYKQIENIIRPCGLAPKKAKAIKDLSQILIDSHEAQVPNNFDDLEALPGVGHKTASVVMSQAFDKPAFPVDTHIHRCAARWKLSNGKSIAQTEKDLKSIYAKKYWKKLHLQIIFFGREYCSARSHDVESCPICSWVN